MSRLAVILFIVLILTSLSALGGELEDVTAQLKRHSAPDAVSAHELAPVIISLSHFYGIPSKLLTSVLLQESKGREKAYNRVTKDTGILQVNIRKAQDLRLSQECLLSWRCNLAAGAKILARTKNQPCGYNLGENRIIAGKFVELCEDYESKLRNNG